jgi:hypothetical protein
MLACLKHELYARYLLEVTGFVQSTMKHRISIEHGFRIRELMNSLPRLRVDATTLFNRDLAIVSGARSSGSVDYICAWELRLDGFVYAGFL